MSDYDRPRCSVPRCNLLSMGRLAERPPSDPLHGKLKIWITTSNRCAHHEKQRPPPRPVDVETFDPETLL